MINARVLAVVLLGLALTTAGAAAQSQVRRAQSVVELYTSQGCIQCPRANRLLGSYAHEDGVLALTFPVGIWDYLGWQDTLARPEFGARQRAYSQALRERRRTPQLVLNGSRQISAADWDDARAAFDEERARGLPQANPEIGISRLSNGRVRVTVGAGPRTAPADVWLIAYDAGPITVEVTGGVNRNRLIAHYNLVDRLERVGSWEGAAVWFERARCAPKCAVIVQEANGGPILGAAYLER
jgi:hypothetical protein